MENVGTTQLNVIVRETYSGMWRVSNEKTGCGYSIHQSRE